jgi:hypothetical protein
MNGKPEIMVYFNSGNKARLPADAVIFANNGSGIPEAMESRCIVVNWANVSYIREFEEPKEDDDL